MIKRTNQHIIDTLAVRRIMSVLPANWLLRSLEERDYGIDAKIELFDGPDPTGNFFLIQIKGQDGPFRHKSPKKSIPTKTVEYAMLFDVPFYVFLNSHKSQKTKFVWLQKYAELVLDQENPSWRSQSTVAIKFPEINDLVQNGKKVEEHIRLESLKSHGLRFLNDCYWFELCHREPRQHADLTNMLNSAERMLKLPKEFYDQYRSDLHSDRHIYEFDLTTMIAQLEQAVCGKPDDEFETFIGHQMMHLDGIRTGFLTRHDTDDFLLAEGGDENIPY